MSTGPENRPDQPAPREYDGFDDHTRPSAAPSADRPVERSSRPAAHDTARRVQAPASADRPVERTDRPAADHPVTDRPAPAPEPAEDQRTGGRTAGVWLALIFGAIILVMLLIFIIQNNVPATFQYLSAEFSLPLGVAMLLAAIAGALIMALVGSVRMIQMSWTIRKLRKSQEKVRRAAR